MMHLVFEGDEFVSYFVFRILFFSFLIDSEVPVISAVCCVTVSVLKYVLVGQ